MLLAAAYVTAYVALDWISYLYPLAPFAITPWNPPPGLSIALLTIAGLRYWPAVLVAVLLAELLVRFGDAQAHPITTIATSLAFVIGYVTVSAILTHVLRFDPRLLRVRDVVWLVVAAVNGSIVVAGAYVGLLVLAEALTPADAFDAVLRLWVGDAIGIVVTAPLVMLFFGSPTGSQTRERWPPIETALQALAVMAALFGVFIIGAEHESSYFYILFLPLIWISLRAGLRGAVWCLVAIQIGLLIGFHFARAPQGSVLELQLLMLAIAITGLMLGAAVSERREALETLGAREAELRAVVSTAPDAILAVDPTGVVTAANPAAEAMFRTSRDRIVGAPLAQFVPGNAHEQPVARNVEVSARRADDTTFPAEASFSGAADATQALRIGVLRDISDRKTMEARLLEHERALDRSMRLASVGELASALAHELNQPLAAIANYVRACQLMLQAEERHAAKLEDAMNRAVAEVARAGEVVRRLRDYFRSGTSRLERIDVATLVATIGAQWADRMRRLSVEFDVTTTANLPRPLADRVQIEIVLHNLLANALDAVESAAEGERRISVGAVIDETNQVAFTVADSGSGLSAEAAATLFQPFSTTKPAGMGLGLAISRSIIENHGGRLWAEPLLRGVAFHFTLPVTERASALEAEET